MGAGLGRGGGPTASGGERRPRAGEAGVQPGEVAAVGWASLPWERSYQTPKSRGGQGGAGGWPFTAVGLVTVVLAVVVPVTDEGRVCADARRALELSWAALELGCREGRLSVSRAGGWATRGLGSRAALTQDPLATPPGHSRQSGGSSEWSPQSSSVSHFHQKGMHLSFLHTNWRAGGGERGWWGSGELRRFSFEGPGCLKEAGVSGILGGG